VDYCIASYFQSRKFCRKGSIWILKVFSFKEYHICSLKISWGNKVDCNKMFADYTAVHICCAFLVIYGTVWVWQLEWVKLGVRPSSMEYFNILLNFYWFWRIIICKGRKLCNNCLASFLFVGLTKSLLKWNIFLGLQCLA